MDELGIRLGIESPDVFVQRGGGARRRGTRSISLDRRAVKQIGAGVRLHKAGNEHVALDTAAHEIVKLVRKFVK
jgi:hypothetical protein